MADVQLLNEGLQFESQKAAREQGGEPRQERDQKGKRDDRLDRALPPLVSRHCGCCGGCLSPA